MNSVRGIEGKIDYSFKNKEYLIRALTHSSYAYEKLKGNGSSNERLEFLGDAVLELIISEYLFFKYPTLPEGELTKMRAALVCEASLAEFALDLGLSEYIRLGKGEEQAGGRKRPALLADVFEALLGAIYLDRDLPAAKSFVTSILEQKEHDDLLDNFDYKTQLQEHMQKHRQDSKLEYLIISEKGPDHDKEFLVAILIDGYKKSFGTGKSKKEAEQKAARKLLQTIKKDYKYASKN